MFTRGLSKDRWHYIPNGVEPRQNISVFQDSAATARVRQWHQEGRFVIVYAGALGRPNHVESLVHAMSLQQQADTRTRAIIVGRGELQSKLIALIAELGLQSRIAIFEQIPKQTVLTLLNEADAGYISLRPEPLFRFGISPNKLFDYMLAGLPVLFAVRAGNNPVQEASCGISVAPSDPEEISQAIDTLAALSPEVRRAMGEQGRAWVQKHHSYASLAHDYLALLKEPCS